MHLTAIATRPNLQLAWRRITTGSNHQYKRYFRHLYSAYELALDENLKDLRVRLLSRTWRPHAADRVYLPKASGLQGPLTLLHIEDQIPSRLAVVGRRAQLGAGAGVARGIWSAPNDRRPTSACELPR